MRKTWSLAQTEEALLLHLEWWRLYYHFVRPHAALKTPNQTQTPAMAAGLATRVMTVGELLRTPMILPAT